MNDVTNDIRKLQEYISFLEKKYSGRYEITYPLSFMSIEINVLRKRAKDIDDKNRAKPLKNKRSPNKLPIEKENNYDGFK